MDCIRQWPDGKIFWAAKMGENIFATFLSIEHLVATPIGERYC